MNNQPQESMPQRHELDNAIQCFGKSLESQQKQRVMQHLREEKIRLLNRHRGSLRQKKDERSR